MARRMRRIDPGPPPTEPSGRTGGSNPWTDAAYYNGPHNPSPATCEECGARLVYKTNQAGNGVESECPHCDGPSPAD